MIAKHETWKTRRKGDIWIGTFLNSQNLLHWHSDMELIAVEQGTIDVFCDGTHYQLTQGEGFLIDSQSMHFMQATDPNTLLKVFVFDRAIIKEVPPNLCLATPKLGKKYPFLATYMALKEELTAKKPYYESMAKNILSQLLFDIFRQEATIPTPKRLSSSQRMKELFMLMQERCEYFTFQDATTFMGMSEGYFSRFFKMTTGNTFSHQLNRIRVERAITLLQEGNYSMTEISARCGFDTIRNFNRIFRQITGYPPTKLPKNFTPNYQLYRNDTLFNPTLCECKLLEEVGN